ncbi:phosphate ABC transporter, permease protein PstC [Halovivax ruber XH-70]|uniref:Phosphate transport system permease protein n=1 Tax=Halovivax ruber (strain DSM 18193 / JCM 13892 / XH-70) TaxID=797302 RepID=L0I941_HALRX|nr:phosphate ABC transporter permease subunit PstC [Halovivax ruber]AGB15308.1 phosphate ABC transporter, permease protein PstC [Halovivax ruber XH-70]
MGNEIHVLQREGIAVQKERLYRYLLTGCALLTLGVTLGIVLALLFETITFFTEVSLIEYLTGTDWSPMIGEQSYGVLPLISGTLTVTIVSAMIALPIGLAIAIYLSEYATQRVRSVLKPALEILAGIPTVIYGYFALVYLTPILDKPLPLTIPILPSWLPVVPEFSVTMPSLGTFNALSASVVVGVMIIPMVSSISEDALSAVPDSLRNAAYGLGSTKFDVSTKVVVPAATSGIISSYVLAISRAIGETMAVTIAMGTSPRMPSFPNLLDNLAQGGQPITAAMVEIANAENRGGVLFESMFALGLTLFVMTLVMNVLAEFVRRRYREVYD